MRRTLCAVALFGAGGLGLAGCSAVEHDTRVPQVTEFTVAPKDARYDQPRETAYTKPAPKKKFEPGLGSGGGPGGMGGGGMGNGMGQ